MRWSENEGDVDGNSDGDGDDNGGTKIWWWKWWSMVLEIKRKEKFPGFAFGMVNNCL